MSKNEVRREARRRLQALTEDQRREWGERVAERVWSAPEIETAESILLYASLPEEVPTQRIASEARARGIQVVYPRCIEDMAMSLHAVDSDDELVEEGRYGLLEPAPHCPVTSIATIDVALIPGLAWDRDGSRVGRGAGYYDRLLAHPDCRAIRCGLFFSVQEFPLSPTDPWDAPLDLVVTEKEVWRKIERQY